MEQQYKAFVIIETLSRSNNELDRYVCLPSTWIKVTDYQNNNVVFKYPSEDRTATITRVLAYQPLDKKWPTLYGKVIHNTDSQSDAYKVLRSKIIRHEKAEDNQSSGDTTGPDDEETTINAEKAKPSSKKTKRKETESNGMMPNIFQAKSKEIKDTVNESFQLSMSKIFEMIQNRKTTLEPNDKLNESLPSSSSSQISESCDALSSKMENTPSTEKAVNVGNSDTQSLKRRSTRPTKIIAEGYSEFSDKDFDTPEDSDYVCSGDESIGTAKKSRKRKITSIPSSPKSVRPVMSEPPKDHDNKKSVNSDSKVPHLNDEVYFTCNKFITEFKKSYENTMSILDNMANYVQQVMSAHEKILMEEQRDNNKKRKKKSESEPLTCDTSYYNTKDSKWTLKHPGPGADLVELVPQTGIYVNEIALIRCQTTYQDATKLARALLTEVFKEEALRMCSFTGCPPKRGKKYNWPGRPGLDLNARQTLITYAKEYGNEMDMRYADVLSITTALKNELQKYRH